MKIISWNVNGIKSKYGNRDYLKTLVKKKRNREKYNPYFLTVIFLLTASLP